jgi:hypothetical protein
MCCRIEPFFTSDKNVLISLLAFIHTGHEQPADEVSKPYLTIPLGTRL